MNKKLIDKHPTDPFIIPEPQNPLIVDLSVVEKRRSADFKALKLWKGRSGIARNRMTLVRFPLFFNKWVLLRKSRISLFKQPLGSY